MTYRTVQLYGIEIVLPISEGALYREAYHGTNQSAAEQISEDGFRPSKRGWYGGNVVYFWIADLAAALWWAIQVQQFSSNWAIIRAVVDARSVLHVDQLARYDDLDRAVRDAGVAKRLPVEWTSSARQSVLAYAILLACEDNGVPVSAVEWEQPIRVLRRCARGICVREPGDIRSPCLVERTEVHSSLLELVR